MQSVAPSALPVVSSYITCIHKIEQLSVSQREIERIQSQLDQERQSHEHRLKELRGRHGERVESVQLKFREREKMMQEQLRQKEMFLKEHRQFVKVWECEVLTERETDRQTERERERFIGRQVTTDTGSILPPHKS